MNWNRFNAPSPYALPLWMSGAWSGYAPQLPTQWPDSYASSAADATPVPSSGTDDAELTWMGEPVPQRYQPGGIGGLLDGIMTRERSDPLEQVQSASMIRGGSNAARALPRAGVSPPFGPIPGGAVQDWWDHTRRGHQGLADFIYRLWRRGIGSGGASGDPEAPGCKEEWDYARRKCADLVSSRNPPRGVTGGYRNVEDCARGLVSERCGGNPVQR